MIVGPNTKPQILMAPSPQQRRVGLLGYGTNLSPIEDWLANEAGLTTEQKQLLTTDEGKRCGIYYGLVHFGADSTAARNFAFSKYKGAATNPWPYIGLFALGVVIGKVWR